MAKFLQTRGPIAIALCPQVLKSGTSAAANYEEADDGSSGRDALAKTRIVLRELKETRLRLQVLRNADILPESYDALIAETTELVKIVAAIIRKKSGGTSSR